MQNSSNAEGKNTLKLIVQDKTTAQLVRELISAIINVVFYIGFIVTFVLWASKTVHTIDSDVILVVYAIMVTGQGIQETIKDSRS